MQLQKRKCSKSPTSFALKFYFMYWVVTIALVAVIWHIGDKKASTYFCIPAAHKMLVKLSKLNYRAQIIVGPKWITDNIRGNSNEQSKHL